MSTKSLRCTLVLEPLLHGLNRVIRLWKTVTGDQYRPDSECGSPVVDDGECTQRFEKPTPSLGIGSVVASRFEINEFLGAGGMGEVYAAYDREIRDNIALKVLRSEHTSNPLYIIRLSREVRTARAVVHENVCKLFDIHPFEVNGHQTAAVSMELLRGTTLSECLRRRRFEMQEVLDTLRHIAKGLDAVHSAGIVHRDLKSANVMIVPNATTSTSPRVVITDFGLAGNLNTQNTRSISDLKAIAGTPGYMAPEHLSGTAAGQAGDIYSFGVIAFEMVTGRLPFQGGTPLAIALRSLKEDPPSMLSFRSDIPVGFDLAVRSCLAKNPKNRPRNASWVMSSSERKPQFRERLRQPATRRVVLASAAVGTGAIAYSSLGRRDQVPQSAVLHLKRAQELLRRRNEENISSAISELRQSLDVDNNYADAWETLASAYCAAAHYDFIKPGTARHEAEKAAHRALAINPKSALAQGSLGYASSMNLNSWRKAGPMFEKAMQMDSGIALNHAMYAAFLGRTGQFTKAIAEAHRAVNIDPGSFYCNHQLAAEYFRARQFKEFYLQSLDLVRLQSAEPSAYLSLARACEWLRRYDDALSFCKRATLFGESKTALCYEGIIRAAMGDTLQATALAAEVERYWSVKPFETLVLANLYGKLRNESKVLYVIHAGYDRDDATILACPTSIYLDDMKSVVAYVQFFRRLGF